MVYTTHYRIGQRFQICLRQRPRCRHGVGRGLAQLSFARPLAQRSNLGAEPWQRQKSWEQQYIEGDYHGISQLYHVIYHIIMEVLPTKTYWCLVGNGWEWGLLGWLLRLCFSPPARWGLLDFMSVASSSSSSSSFSSLFSSSFSSPLFSSPRLLSSCSLPDFNHDHPRPVCPAGPQPRPSTPSVPCRTSTASIRAQCSLPGLNHDHPRPVFPAGPQPRGSMPSVPCRTSCRKIWDKECAQES